MRFFWIVLLVGAAISFSGPQTRKATGVTRAWAKGVLEWDPQPNGTRIVKDSFSLYLKEDLTALQPRPEDDLQVRRAKISQIASKLREVVDYDNSILCLPKRLGPSVETGQPLNYFMVVNANPSTKSERRLLGGQVRIIDKWLIQGYLD